VATEGVAATFDVDASDGNPPLTYTADFSGLPAGGTYAIDPATGVVTATFPLGTVVPPAADATFVVPVTATDVDGDPVTADLTITVVAPLFSVAADLTAVTAMVGDAVTVNITTAGGTAPIAITADVLPAGLNLTDNGDGTATITGNVTTAETVTTTVTATDAGGLTSTVVINFTINPPVVVTTVAIEPPVAAQTSAGLVVYFTTDGVTGDLDVGGVNFVAAGIQPIAGTTVYTPAAIADVTEVTLLDLVNTIAEADIPNTCVVIGAAPVGAAAPAPGDADFLGDSPACP